MQIEHSNNANDGLSTRPMRFSVALAGAGVAIASLMLWMWLSDAEASPGPAARAELSVTPEVPVASTNAGAFGWIDQLTEQQQRGKHIYLTGKSPSGQSMTAVLGNSNTDVPASVLTCVNCHRHDGRGKPEGGIYPSNIRWQELTKPYVAKLPRGQSRPPYDELSLKRCITMGLNPAGDPVDPAMPRYRMIHSDLADLTAYLKVLGRERDPGVSDKTVRIGVVLPPSGSFPTAGPAVRRALQAQVSGINRRGGIYQRRINLLFMEAPQDKDERAGAVVNFVKRERVFALVGSFIAGSERAISAALAETGVPLVGARTMFPQTDFPLIRNVFYVTSGLDGQLRALITHSKQAGHPEGFDTVLLSPEVAPDDVFDSELQAVVGKTVGSLRFKGRSLKNHAVPRGAFDAVALVDRMAGDRETCVISLLSAEQNHQFLMAAARRGWFPRSYIPGAFVGPELFTLPREFNNRIFLSFPELPAKHPVGMSDYNSLAREHSLSPDALATQFAALAALRVLVEGLEQTGSALSRERLTDQIETLKDYRSGFAPPVTFGPNRRVGAQGAYVVSPDLAARKLRPVSDWIDGSAHDR